MPSTTPAVTPSTTTAKPGIGTTRITTTVASTTTATSTATPALSKPLVCYFTNWAQYRTGAGKYTPTNVDPHLCTHLIYAFAVINDANELSTYEWNDETLYRSFNGLKEM